LSISATPAEWTGSRYRAVASNIVGAVSSSVAVLNVQTAPSILRQPSPQTVMSGATASFTVGAAGNPPPQVRWQKSVDAGASWIDVPNTSPYSGVDSSTLTIVGVPRAFDGVRFRGLATNSIATTNSA